MRAPGHAKRHGGFTLIEMIIAILILGVGIAGLLSSFNVGVRGSADPLIGKQLLATAEGMMEEILLKPYAVNGNPPANAEVKCGPAASRDGSDAQRVFDDLLDYNGYQTQGVCDVAGAPVAGLGQYDVAVSVTGTTLQDGVAAQQITVTVTNNGYSVTLNGFRTQE